MALAQLSLGANGEMVLVVDDVVGGTVLVVETVLVEELVLVVEDDVVVKAELKVRWKTRSPPLPLEALTIK